jgi:hypothetical protein
MPPRKRKPGTEQAAQEGQQQPDRDEVARSIQEKLHALDQAGEGALCWQVGPLAVAVARGA